MTNAQDNLIIIVLVVIAAVLGWLANKGRLVNLEREYARGRLFVQREAVERGFGEFRSDTAGHVTFYWSESNE